jgi:hypothetical protein
MRRRIRRWWRAAVAAAAILSPQAAAADSRVDEVPIAATPYAFDPAMVAVTAGVTSIEAPASAAEDDMNRRLAEPDFTLIALPTALRVPRFKSSFRVTHRFTQPLNANAGDVASTLFGLDSEAQIGLEYRFGIVKNGEVGIHRTSDKTLEFFGQYGILRQTPSRPVDMSVLVSVEGTNNFRDQYSPAVGAIVSRTFGERAALYVEPAWVHHANVQSDTAIAGAPTDTVMVGLGGRFRVRPTVSIVAEFSPRLSGFRPGVNHGGLAIEKRAGGHMFQLNVSDSFATTMGQIARGGPEGTNWHLGFNISRKFF